MITVKTIYKENEVVSKFVYNKKGNPCEVTEVNRDDDANMLVFF